MKYSSFCDCLWWLLSPLLEGLNSPRGNSSRLGNTALTYFDSNVNRGGMKEEKVAKTLFASCSHQMLAHTSSIIVEIIAFVAFDLYKT